VKQVSEYRKLIERYRRDILTSYPVVAQNLVCIAKMAQRYDELSPLIKDVANGVRLFVDPANVGVVIFGFSQADKNSDRHDLMKCKLEGDAGLAVTLKGDARGLPLQSAVPRHQSHLA
jgi:hypothetical protein